MKRKWTIIIIITAILLSYSWILLHSNTTISNLEKKVEVSEANVQLLENTVDEVESQYSIAIQLNDEINKKNEALKTEIQKKDELIATLREDIDLLQSKLDSEKTDDTTSNHSLDHLSSLSGFFNLLNLYRLGEYNLAYEMVSDSYYYIDYRNDEVITSYINKIFEEDDTLTIEKIEYVSNGCSLKDDDGNEIYFSYYRRNGNMYYFSTIIYAAEFDRRINAFIEALKTEDIESLGYQMVEMDLSPDKDDVERVIAMYKEDYDLSTLNVEFVRASGLGFEYQLSGSKNGETHSELIHVDIDTWSYIVDYRGRYEWTGHNAPTE